MTFSVMEHPARPSAIVVARDDAALHLLLRNGGGMPKLTVEMGTDEHGYFSKTVPFNVPGTAGATVRLTVTLLSPFATGVWGKLDIDARDAVPLNRERAFVVWHSEMAQLGSWRLDDGAHVIVVNGKTNPTRANTRLVLEIDVGW